MKRFTPTEGLTHFFLIGLFLLVFFFRGQIPLWRSQLLFYALLFGLLFVLKLSSDRKKSEGIGGLLNGFSPVAFIIFTYQSLGNMIQYLQPDIDPYLIQIDLFLFGVHPTVWVERWINPWFTDLMSLAYISYYFLPVILAITLYLRGRREEFHQTMFILTFGYYLSFIGYILFPAIGPRFTLAHLQSIPLEGSFFSDLVRDLLNAIEHNKRDCMPSGHTQIALMVLFLARRYEKTIYYIFLPIVCGLILSTVYLRYHYVIDLIAGAALAIGCILVAPTIYRRWKVEG
ncbi:MAG: phosphatase PAP2 family protein [Thermodesulfobacteriota bacterium]|nr:phosphatase PAP2 family protein [Thermodesulfobacteriota bacterium]